MKNWQRRGIGILTLGGGATGFSVALMLLFSRTNPIEWLFCIAFMAIYAWGVWSGTRMLEGAQGSERSALKYWIIQIPTFGSPYFGYFLSSGFHTTVSLQFAPLAINGNFLLGSAFTYSLLQVKQPWSIGINLFAGALAWWLSSLLRRCPPNSSFEPEPPRDAIDPNGSALSSASGTAHRESA